MATAKRDCRRGRIVVAGAVVLAALAVWAEAKTMHVSTQKLAEVAVEEQTRTIADAVRGVAAGDRIIVHSGTYRESVVVAASGTAEKPIIVEAATAEHAVVTGADLLTDWKREDEKERIFSTPWPHKFIGWNRTNTHPGDDFHLLIGRCEQVFAEHYPLRQVLSRDKLSRGTFFADTEGKRLYVWTANNADLSKRDTRVEASVRDAIWNSQGSHILVRGLRFRYAANMAQHGAVAVSGNNNTFEDCLLE
ncbi:MAG: chondroitinase-B domain-containing protein, partial [Tepidisphaeraceae bacterium]